MPAISESTLAVAVERGLLTGEQVQSLRELEVARSGLAETSEEAVPGGDEPLRLIGGGNDLFVTVGTVLLMSGFLFVLNTVIGGRTLWIAGLVAAFSWVVAEIVTRQQGSCSTRSPRFST